MSKYHVNSRGEPGRCRALQGSCPFGGTDAHYDSREKAYEAIAKEHGGSFGGQTEELPKIGMFNKVNVAEKSTDPKELLAIAKSANKKVVSALIDNPATPPEALLEARSSGKAGSTLLVNIELHKNYPVSGITLEGANYIAHHKAPSEIKTMMAEDGVNDMFIDQIKYYEDRRNEDFGVSTALRNPNNNITNKQRGITVNFNPQKYLQPAVESGKFPSRADINGGTMYYDQDKKQFGPLSDEILTKSVEYSTNEETATEIYKKYKGTNNELPTLLAIKRNANLSEEYKTKILSESKELLDLLNN